VWNVNPLPSDIMQEGDVIVLIGFNKDLKKLEA
jgi:K+/H+ antiporter YhaU regulatory subunit KhtT